MEPFVSKTTANPFKELYKNSSQFNKATPAIISDYDNLITISINLTQEAEKFRKQANRYKHLNEHLVEQCDKLKHEYEYIDARYAMAKKWLKNEFELREAAEKDRVVISITILGTRDSPPRVYEYIDASYAMATKKVEKRVQVERSGREGQGCFGADSASL